MARWLAVYMDKGGKPASAMITPRNPTDFAFGIIPDDLRLDNWDWRQNVTLVEMPEDDSFRPMVVDVHADVEVPIQFIDI